VITADLSWQAAADVTGTGSGLWPYARYPGALAGVGGTIAVVDGLSVLSARLPAAMTVPPTKIEVGGDAVRVPRLQVHMGDMHAMVAGRVHGIDWRYPQDGALEAELSGSVDGRGLGRWLGDGASSGGTARFAGRLSGSVGAPRVAGQANFDDLSVSWPRSPVGTVNVNGPIAIDGRKLTVGPLMVRTGNGGWLKIAGPRGAGKLTVAPGRAPLPVDDVDVTVQGGGLGTTRPVSGLSVEDLALGLRLAEDMDNRLRLTGQVHLGPTVFDLREQRKGAKVEGANKRKTAAAKRPAGRPSALDRITVDVRLTGPDDAVEVRVPFVPDVTVGLDCRVQGTLASPHIAGHVRGSGAYSRAALTTADRFTDRDLRQCDLGPR
jgi:autotransporter translocation and assembly factor TamB